MVGLNQIFTFQSKSTSITAYRLLGVLLVICASTSLRLVAQEQTQQLTFMRDGNVILFDVDSGTEAILIEDANPYSRDISWSPDGSLLAFYRDHQFHILDPNTNNMVQLEIAPEGIEASLSGAINWSPDSKKIAYNISYLDQSLEAEAYAFYTIETSPEAKPNLIDEDAALNIQWTTDSQEVIYKGATSGYYRFDLETGSKEELDIPRNEYLRFSPDRNLAATHTNPSIGENAYLKIYDIITGEINDIAYAREIQDEAFSPNDKWIAFEWDSGIWGDRISIVNLETEQETEVAAAEFGDIDYWRWSPDSTLIAYLVPYRVNAQSGFRLYIVNIETLEDRLIADDGSYPKWSPDSQWLAYSKDRTAYIVNLFDDTTWQIPDVDYIVGWHS